MKTIFGKKELAGVCHVCHDQVTHYDDMDNPCCNNDDCYAKYYLEPKPHSEKTCHTCFGKGKVAVFYEKESK